MNQSIKDILVALITAILTGILKPVKFFKEKNEISH